MLSDTLTDSVISVISAPSSKHDPRPEDQAGHATHLALAHMNLGQGAVKQAERNHDDDQAGREERPLGQDAHQRCDHRVEDDLDHGDGCRDPLGACVPSSTPVRSSSAPTGRAVTWMMPVTTRASRPMPRLATRLRPRST